MDAANAAEVLPHLIGFTIAAVLGEKTLAKTLAPKPEDCKPYDKGYLFDFSAKDFDTLEAFAAILERMAVSPRHALLRGALKDGKTELHRAVRRVKDRIDEPATFEEETRRAVIVFDIDGEPVSDWLAQGDVLTLPAEELRAGIAPLLPPELSGVDWVLSVTSSTGRYAGKLRLRIFIPLTQPVTGAVAKAYTVAWTAETGVALDPCVCEQVQPIYTSRPVFINGAADPVPSDARVKIVRGDARAGTLNERRIVQGKEFIAKDKATMTRLGKDWRAYLTDALGGPLSFRKPLESALGIAVNNGEDEDDAVAFCLGLLADRADRVRCAHYNERWLRDAYQSFARGNAERPVWLTLEEMDTFIAAQGELDRLLCEAFPELRDDAPGPKPEAEPEVKATDAKAEAEAEAEKIKVAPPKVELKARWLKTDKGVIIPNLANVITLFEVNGQLADLFRFNELSQATDLLRAIPTVKGRQPPKQASFPRGLADDDITSILDFVQHNKIAIQSRDTIVAAIENVARRKSYHPFRDYLEGLEWDGVARADNLFLGYFHASGPAEYLKMVGRFFLLGLAKRAYSPGCQNDYMPVLEGSQGKQKTKALETLGGKFFGGGPPDIHTKDFKQYLTGKMLVEIAEMDAMRKAEISAVKRILTEKNDDYRPPYGKLFRNVPRSAVFAGTTNDNDTNRDVTGARRFWYVSIGQMIDLVGLARDRDQLFAEAVARMKAGERYWPTPEEEAKWFKPEQDARFEEDEWAHPIAEWIAAGGNNLEKCPGFTGIEAAHRCLGIPNDRYGRAEQNRIRRIFIWLGCYQPTNVKTARRYWLPPDGGIPGYPATAPQPKENVVDLFPPGYGGKDT
jgi:predicted P-loop ATPase